MAVRPQLVLLTGPRESGKTTRLGKLVARARRAGQDVAGLMTHPVVRQGERVALMLEELRSGERRLLAIPNRDGRDGSYWTKRWRFDPGVLAWGNRALMAATPCALLIVDELGKLELTRNLGFTAAITALGSQDYRLAVAVVRPELLRIAQQQLPQATVVVQRPRAR